MTVKGIQLTDLQRKIYDACRLDTPHTFIVVSCGRQVGKSTVASQVICNWCFNNKLYKVGFYAPTYRQSREQFKRMVKGLQNIPGVEHNKTELIITFSNGSYVQFMTADTDSMRGSTYHSIVVDEACFVKSDIYSAGILPTVAVSLSNGEGKVLLISTPKSKNWFYDMFKSEMEGKISYKATSEEGGLISKELLKQIKTNTPEYIYNNEYLAEFLEAGQGVFAYTDCVMTEKPTLIEGCIAGLDFGMENDYTALVIMNRLGQVVAVKRWRKMDWAQLIDEVVRELKHYKVNRVYAEINGIGNMPAKMLQKKFNATSFWTTTNKSKVDIVNKLSADFQQQLIQIPNTEYLLDELDSYTVEYTPATGKVTYNARKGFNDDTVMALAIANWNRITAAKRFIASR